MIDIFQTVKEKISTLQAAEFYGLKPRQKGTRYWCLCPFHNDKKPSMCIYPKGGFKCYSCNTAGADAISLISKLNSIKPLEAAKRIIEDFGLQIVVDGYKEKIEIDETLSDYDLYVGLKAWSKAAFDSLCDLYKVTRKLLKTYTDPEKAFEDELFAALVLLHEDLDYWTNILINGSLQDVLNLYKLLNKKGVCYQIE